MRENFDYVTFANYESDMKESSDQAVRAINFVKDRAERAEKMLALVVLAAGGEVKIFDQDLTSLRKIELTTWRDDADMSYRLTVSRT